MREYDINYWLLVLIPKNPLIIPRFRIRISHAENLFFLK